MARKFFYVCAGLFLLALSFHFGYSTATAQAPGNPVAAAWQASQAGTGIVNAIVTTNGDVYRSGNLTSWDFYGNVFGGPTPALHESWGSLKARYAPNNGPVSKPADNR